LLLAPDTLVTLAMSVKNRCAMDKDNRSSFFPDVDQSNTETEYQVALNRVSSDVGSDGASEPEDDRSSISSRIHLISDAFGASLRFITTYNVTIRSCI
jgi:hypothetical protein